MAEKRTYSFNSPWAALFLLPMAFLSAMLVAGLTAEFNILAILVLALTLLFMFTIAYMGFLRRVSVGEGWAEWITPQTQYRISLAEVRHFGIIKYRSFRFIYLSDAVEPPFNGPNARVAPDAHTVILQYRKRAWQFIEASMAQANPNLKPNHLVRR